MPELPEVEIVRRGLAPVLGGRRIVRVIARRPDLRFPVPADFSDTLAGRTVDAVDRRAKYLLVHLCGDLVILAHLGMSGRFRVFRGDAPPPDVHDHVDFETDEGSTVRFRDPRRFGFMDLCRCSELQAHPRLVGLGPEPLSDGFTGAFLSARLAGRATPVKSALLDQSVVAGMGNIYACESLFRAGLSPKRAAGTITGRRAERLTGAIKSVFLEAIAAGGSSLRDHARPSGELGTFQHRFAVYGRTGQPCPGCDGNPMQACGIRRIVQAGRSTFYCAKRQR